MNRKSIIVKGIVDMTIFYTLSKHDIWMAAAWGVFAIHQWYLVSETFRRLRQTQRALESSMQAYSKQVGALDSVSPETPKNGLQ